MFMVGYKSRTESWELHPFLLFLDKIIGCSMFFLSCFNLHTWLETFSASKLF